jgi:hypothetical protein
MGVAAPIIGGVGTVAGLIGQSNQASAQKAAAADQQAMLAKQAFYNALALNAAKQNLAYDFDNQDLQQRTTDLQAVQQNFQTLMQSREQYLATNGQVDKARYDAQKQYFDTLFQQGQQSTASVFESSKGNNDRLFSAGVNSLQASGQAVKQAQDTTFGAASTAMKNEFQASSQGLNNMLQAGTEGLQQTGQALMQGGNAVFETGNQLTDQYTQGVVDYFGSQSQGFNELGQVSDQLTAQAQDIKTNQEKVNQQQSALQTMYAALVGGSNMRSTLSGQRLDEQNINNAVTTQQQFEQGANKALGNTQRQADYRNAMSEIAMEEAGSLGLLGLDNAAEMSGINFDNISILSFLNNLNAAGNYNRDTNFARDMGALDTGYAAMSGVRDVNNTTAANQLNLDYANYQGSLQNSFLGSYLNNLDRAVGRGAMGTLQQTNAGLNNTAMNAAGQKQAAEQAYLAGNYQIQSQSMINRLAALAAMQTGMNNASLQSDANATLNQAQQAALKMQAAGIRGPNLGDYANAGLGIAQGLSGAFGGNKMQATPTYNTNSSLLSGYGTSPTFGNTSGINYYGSSPGTSYSYTPNTFGF